MAMVDALDHFPPKHPGRDSIIAILNRFAKAVTAVQDMKSGLWYDVVDKPGAPKNYVEASASSMLVYTLAKGVRKGYLPASYLVNAKKGYDGILRQFIKTENGQVNLYGTVAVSGLGGNPYRDGSYEYYMSEPVVVNDPKGMVAFNNAAVEMEMESTQRVGKGKSVMLDYYFNNEWKKDATGTDGRFHYTWEDKSNSGFSMLGDVFQIYGAKTVALETSPDPRKLKGADIYVIVDPDTEKETARPKYIGAKDIKVITDWVKGGGVLVLLGNDSGNAEFNHFNTLSEKFGVHFNEDSKNRVEKDKFDQGAVMVTKPNTVFSTAEKLYIKELSSLQVKSPATVVLKKDNINIMAIARYGKGIVFMLGDPWLYNEYVDGRKLPADFDNYKAATDLVQWLIKQVPARK
jgi:unsaturated rhamnogalacturonyl hydrolase